MADAGEREGALEGTNRYDDSGPGVVYVMSNQATGNSVTIFDRAADGSLTQGGTFPTGGLGGGSVTNPIDSLFSQGSLVLSKDPWF